MTPTPTPATEKITYNQAKEAKEILLQYITEQGIDYLSINELIVYLALTQDYFLQ